MTTQHDQQNEQAEVPEPSYDEALGRRVAELRKARNLTQEALANSVSRRGVSFRQQTVVKLEKGQRSLKAQEAVVIARALGVEVDVLLDVSETRYTEQSLLYAIGAVEKEWHAARLALLRLLDVRNMLRNDLNEVATLDARNEIATSVLDEAVTIAHLDPVLVAKATERLHHLDQDAREARWALPPVKFADKYDEDGTRTITYKSAAVTQKEEG